MAQLTPRQQDIMKLLAEGYSQKETAKALGMAYGTVRKHTLAARERKGDAGGADDIEHLCIYTRVNRGATPGVASFHSEAGGWQRSI